MSELLKRFLKPYRWRVVVGVACKMVEVVFDLMTPVIVARMIDRGVASHDAHLVIRYGLLLIFLACLGYCFTLVCQKMAAIVSQGTGTNLRNALFEKVGQLSAADIDRFGTPSLVTRITSDVNQVQVAIALGIRQLIRWPLLAVGSVVAALLIDLRLGLVFLVCTPIIGIVFWFVMSRSVPFFKTMQTRLDKVSLVCREALSGARVIRAFRREDHEEKRFKEAANEQAATAIAVGKLSSVLNPATMLVMNLGIVAILWAGAYRVNVGSLSQGQIMAFVNYMSQTLLAIVYVANLVVTFTRGAASGQRIMEVLDCKPSITDKGAQPVSLACLTSSTPALSLDHASFLFPGSSRPAVSDVSLSLQQGQTLGIIGGTGSGKTTLVSLLNRLYEVSSGSVSVFGRDVREWPLDELRHVVSIVPQQAALISGTVRSNLSWRKADASDEDLWSALSIAQADDFMRIRKNGLDAPVEADGKNFSGGQKQRLTIARALVDHPKIAILDDSASALDFATDARLRSALRSLSGELTCVVVSQRVSAVMSSDLVLVLDHGAVAGLGTHDELIEQCPIYREICLSQLSAEEVGA